ncbi:hypothetical protein BJB45_02535 [Halomonas huangheensis]|uniref:Uncharacterized protein n=1 Tax=Halomonas huangheensis TaxID=1178482 RepID=W1N3G2_9GAMM|nr:hypothetical protein AR456_04025 [Halomonas huangheensis]ERL50024.1 hypothetical protein BJB45_02535 [Halomonas huangheensis]
MICAKVIVQLTKEYFVAQFMRTLKLFIGMSDDNAEIVDEPGQQHPLSGLGVCTHELQVPDDYETCCVGMGSSRLCVNVESVTGVDCGNRGHLLILP